MDIQPGPYNPEISDVAKETGGNLDDIKTAVESLVSFEIPDHDQIVLTYVATGNNGADEIETVVYKLSGAIVQTLTLSYDTDDRLIDIIKT